MSTATPARSVTVVVIEVDGTARREDWTPEPGGGLLGQLQAAVGGRFDVVTLAGECHVDMWIHDEGLYVCEPNPVATAIAMGNGRSAQPYFGPVVFTGGPDEGGATQGLDGSTADRLLHVAREVAGNAPLLAAVAAASARFADPYR